MVYCCAKHYVHILGDLNLNGHCTDKLSGSVACFGRNTMFVHGYFLLLYATTCMACMYRIKHCFSSKRTSYKSILLARLARAHLLAGAHL